MLAAMPGTNGAGPLGGIDPPGPEPEVAATLQDGDPTSANGSEAG
jgi:hypothetical protein